MSRHNRERKRLWRLGLHPKQTEIKGRLSDETIRLAEHNAALHQQERLRKIEEADPNRPKVQVL